MNRRPTHEDTEPWYRRLSVFEWACLLLFVVPGLGYLLLRLPQLVQFPIDFWLTGAPYASSASLLPISYAVITWSAYTAVSIGPTRGRRLIDKSRLVVHTVRPFLKFPAMLLVVLLMTVEVIPEDFPTDVVLKVLLGQLVGLFLAVGCIAGLVTHLSRTRPACVRSRARPARTDRSSQSSIEPEGLEMGVRRPTRRCS